MKTFKHNFKDASGKIDINGINGFTQCLNQLYFYLREVTEMNPVKRMIDAVPILEIIEDTNAELSILLAQAGKDIAKDLKPLTTSEHDLLAQEQIS